METKSIYTIKIGKEKRHILAVSKFHALELAAMIDEYKYAKTEYKIKKGLN